MLNHAKCATRDDFVPPLHRGDEAQMECTSREQRFAARETRCTRPTLPPRLYRRLPQGEARGIRGRGARRRLNMDGRGARGVGLGPEMQEETWVTRDGMVTRSG